MRGQGRRDVFQALAFGSNPERDLHETTDDHQAGADHERERGLRDFAAADEFGEQ
jgi:hypothetical protein